MSVTEELRIKGMHCDACEKTITRALGKEGLKVESISYKTGKAVVSGPAVPKDRIDQLLSEKGYSIAGEKTLSHSAQTYEFEKRIIGNGLLTLAIMLILQAVLALFIYKLFPNYTTDHFIPLLYVPIVVVANIIALWHQRAYSRNVSCMTGMMIGMTIGMTTGFAIGGIVGLTNGMFIGSLVGVGAAMIAGIYAGRCCGIMGTMEGMMAGLMGGTMGPMLSVMMINDHINIFLPILIALTVVILAGLMKITVEEHEGTRVETKPWPLPIVLGLSALFTIGISIIILLAPRSALW